LGPEEVELIVQRFSSALVGELIFVFGRGLDKEEDQLTHTPSLLFLLL
jgi:hypothetical protein